MVSILIACSASQPGNIIHGKQVEKLVNVLVKLYSKIGTIVQVTSLIALFICSSGVWEWSTCYDLCCDVSCCRGEQDGQGVFMPMDTSTNQSKG